MLLRLFIFTFFLTAMNVFSQTPAIETGVSQTLAKWRAANYSDVRYKLNITLEKGAPLMKGEIEIRVKLTGEAAKEELILDWRTTQFQTDKDKPTLDVIQVNESVIKELPPSGNYDYRIDKEHLFIAPRHLKAGENFIRIQFASPIKTSGAAITRYVDKEDGAEYVYSLFVPSDASTAFPVFDQPDLKARFKLEIIAPIDWQVISNGWLFQSNANENFSPKSVEALSKIAQKKYEEDKTEGFPHPFEGLKHSELKSKIPQAGKKWIFFNETKPISTYVFAFAAGNFQKFEERNVSSVVSETQSSIYVRKSQAEKFKQHATEVFRLNREGVKFLESYFDYKFPFPKYDLVLIPEFPFGGMEHAGATFLREDRVVFPTEPTKNDFVTRANLIFHEAAHQWFGDTVTMRWFDDLWLKEGFAEFMAYKTLEKVMPEYNAWKIFYERNKQAAYLTDSTRGTTPIYQEIPNLSAAKSAYGNIVYRKAPSFLKQAEFYLGEKEFQKAVRAFLKKHEFANAEWTDLVKEFETASEKDLKDWGNGWVKTRSLPIVRVEQFGRDYDSEGNIVPASALGNTSIFYFYQDNALQENNTWTMNVKAITLSKDGKKEIKTIYLTKRGIYKNVRQVSGALETKLDVSLVFPNYQDYGYGIFLLDEKSRAYVLANIQNEKDDFLRTMMWGALWDSVREAELAPQDYVELVVKNLNVETDESTIQTILGRVSTAMNYYLSDKQRRELAWKLEPVLFSRMRDAKTLGQRITFFRAYLNLASTDNAQKMLKQILKSDGKPIEFEPVPGIMPLGKIPPLEVPPLKTKDKFDIVTKLLILENKRIIGNNEAEKLLAELEKTETSDEAKRYAYAARAAIGKAANKEKFWTDFVGSKELSESWIESAFVPFNSPRHSELTLPYLEKALAELPNLKKNRKIFFVNGWLAAFIGGQQSEQALEIVNKFLADNPNLDRDLRLKILENADGLERAVKIREKYGK